MKHDIHIGRFIVEHEVSDNQIRLAVAIDRIVYERTGVAGLPCVSNHS